jgi:hypothetical protein
MHRDMSADCVLLRIAEARLTFWQGQLQAAFRTGSHERAAECTRMIAEYVMMMREATKQLDGVLPERC